jgi:hypothetical protein
MDRHVWRKHKISYCSFSSHEALLVGVLGSGSWGFLVDDLCLFAMAADPIRMDETIQR